MILFFNLIGIGWFILAFGLAAALDRLFAANSSSRLFFLAGLFLIILDGVYRYFHVRQKLAEAFEATKAELGFWKTPPRLMWPISNHGGNLMLMPAWIFGILVVLLFGTGLF